MGGRFTVLHALVTVTAILAVAVVIADQVRPLPATAGENLPQVRQDVPER
jgi:hypothetical protein